MTSTLHLPLLAAMLSLACAGTAGIRVPRAAPENVDAVRQALEAADSLLARSVQDAGPARGFWPALAENALFLEPDLDLLRGHVAIRSALASVEDSAVTMKLHRVASGRSEDGGFGYTLGWLELLSKAAPPRYAKYLAAWRSDGGPWRLLAFAKSAGRAPPSPAPEGNPVVAGYHGLASPADPASLAAQVARTDSAFAAAAETETTCAAFAAFADRNAVVFGSADFYWGLDAVRSAHSSCKPADRATWEPVASASAGSGDLAFTVGNAVFTSGASTPASAARNDDPYHPYSYSKYLTVWARQPDGSWKWLLDAGSPRPAPQRAPRHFTVESGDPPHVAR